MSRRAVVSSGGGAGWRWCRATEVRNNFGKYLNRIHRGEEYVVVEKLGIPVAVGIKDARL